MLKKQHRKQLFVILLNARIQRANAFTLIEVLIALIVLAIAFTALFETTRSNINSSITIKKALVSNWVAMNVFSSIELGLAPKPAPGSNTEGSETMLGTEWQWTASTDQAITDSSGLERIVITVYQQGKPCQHLVGFVQ